ncbi:MAG: ABC transporter permease [Gammaproteobacteria bacterium]|nr:MAG: ABC transporter permease [Gammaproteobacteria bacterium]
MNTAELSTIIAAATPLLLAALGELVVEKAGVLNLGIEGMMLVGAIVGFIMALGGQPAVACFIAAALAAVAMSLIFAFLVLILRANQVATGLALAIFGTGLSSTVGAAFVGQPIDGLAKVSIPVLSDIPLVGKVLFAQDYIVYLSLIILVAVMFFLYRTKAGLVLRGVGENHTAAYALGHRVITVRFAAIAFGGAMAGIAGAYMSLVSPHLWTLGLTAGRGWIALALVVFAAWRPLRLLVGAYFFGAISVLQYSFQHSDIIQVPSQVWAMLPYLATIIVLVVISNRKAGSNLNAPADLGKPFIPNS